MRLAERRFCGLLFQEPPRTTRRQGAVQAPRGVADTSRPRRSHGASATYLHARRARSTPRSAHRPLPARSCRRASGREVRAAGYGTGARCPRVASGRRRRAAGSLGTGRAHRSRRTRSCRDGRGAGDLPESARCGSAIPTRNGRSVWPALPPLRSARGFDINIVHGGGQSLGRATPKERYVAGHKIDARELDRERPGRTIGTAVSNPRITA